MGQLRALQRTFWEACRGTATPEAEAATFLGDARLSGPERIGLYRNMYQWRQQIALSESFPKLHLAIGDARMARLTREYIAAWPSEEPAIEHLGRALPAFLAEGWGDLPPFIADLAALEWARTVCIIAPEPAAIAAPSEVDPATFSHDTLTLSPALRLEHLRPAALKAWNETPPDERDDRRVPVAVWRQGFGVRHLALPADEGAALAAALEGQPLAEVCAAFGARQDDVERAFAALLSWFKRQWVVRVDHDGEAS